MHLVESKHLAIPDQFFADDYDSSNFAESVNYDYPDSTYCVSESYDFVHMAPGDTKRFVDNLKMDETEFLAESRIVSGAEDTDENGDSDLSD